MCVCVWGIEVGLFGYVSLTRKEKEREEGWEGKSRGLSRRVLLCRATMFGSCLVVYVYVSGTKEKGKVCEPKYFEPASETSVLIFSVCVLLLLCSRPTKSAMLEDTRH